MTTIDQAEIAAATQNSKLKNVPPAPLRDQNSPYAVAAFVGVVYLGLLAWLWGHFHGDPTGFIHQGTVWLNANRQGTDGYDGQFYYYIALHPTHAVQFLDLPAIRLQRIFYPLLIDLVSLGQRPLMPYAMLLINYAAVVVGTLLVARLLEGWGRSPWFALCYAFAGGIPIALTFDTPEPLAYALVAAAVLFWEKRSVVSGQWSVVSGQQSAAEETTRNSESPTPHSALRITLYASLAFALALLTREHALYFVAAYAGAALLRRDWRGLVAAVAAFMPVTLWGAYLSATLGKSSISELPSFNWLPFNTFWVQGNLVDPTWRSVGYAAQYIVPTALFGLLALGGLFNVPLAWLRERAWHPPSALLLAMLGSAQLMVFLPLVGYKQQVAPSRYALGLALAAVLWAGSAKPRWLLWLTPLVALGLLGYVYGLITMDPAYLW
ncbi:MAG: hypothetical protein ACR2M0_07395 [Chloroflexia bacterium]